MRFGVFRRKLKNTALAGIGIFRRDVNSIFPIADKGFVMIAHVEKLRAPRRIREIPKITGSVGRMHFLNKIENGSTRSTGVKCNIDANESLPGVVALSLAETEND